MKKMLLAVALLLGTTACGSGYSDDETAVYSPAAYYATVDNVYECWYISSTAEAYALENAGLCPRYAIPTPMPLAWEEEYWDYYSSPAYYGTYIPASYRRAYVSVTCVRFRQTYSSQITRLSKTAVYRSSTGGTVRGATKTTTFSSSTKTTVNYSVPSRSNSYSTYRRNR